MRRTGRDQEHERGGKRRATKSEVAALNARTHAGQYARSSASASEIQAALAVKQLDRAADIAETRIGMTSLASHGAAHMAQYMPKGMQDIGTEMHHAASRI